MCKDLSNFEDLENFSKSLHIKICVDLAKKGHFFAMSHRGPLCGHSLKRSFFAKSSHIFMCNDLSKFEDLAVKVQKFG